jgi:hypothetical protein
MSSNSIISSLFSQPLPSKLQAGKAASGGLTATAGQSAEDKFMAYAKMSPADRMRASILSSMGITEDQLKNMSPEQQKAVEQKIEDLIKQAAQKQIEKNGGVGFFADIKA